MIEATQTDEMRIAFGDAVCPEGRYWIALKVESGCESSAALLRPFPALRLGAMIVCRSIVGLLFKK